MAPTPQRTQLSLGQLSENSISGKNIINESVFKEDLNISTPGSAVIRKIIAGENITLTSTGIDTGTGDVTISVNSIPSKSDYFSNGNFIGSASNLNVGCPDNTINIALDYNITLEKININVSLVDTGVTPGTYSLVNVDSKGRITSGFNPTTLAGLGITDALNNVSNSNIPLTNGSLSSYTRVLEANSENQRLDTLPQNIYGAVKYVILVTNGTNRQVCEILVMHDDYTAIMTEYANIVGGPLLATFSSVIEDGNLCLNSSPQYLNTTFKILRMSIND